MSQSSQSCFVVAIAKWQAFVWIASRSEDVPGLGGRLSGGAAGIEFQSAPIIQFLFPFPLLRLKLDPRTRSRLVCVFASQAMDLYVKFVVAVDWNAVCRRMLCKTLPEGCVLSDLGAFLNHRGQCDRHGGICRIPTEGADFCTAGLPCHPFSHMRWKEGGTPGTRETEAHREFDLVVKDFPEMIATRRPGASPDSIEFHCGVF